MSALRTISLRLRGTSVSILEEMGEETDGVVESVSKMQEKIEAITGVNILTDSGAYKDTYTILNEIGQVWEDMSDIDQAALLELMAGKNRANTLAAILGNMEDLEGAYSDALKAEGSALKENEAYLDSIQGRIDLFNNSVQTMWMNFINDDVVKFIVDLGTALMKVVNLVGPLNVALAGLFGGMFAKYKMKQNNTDIFSILFETIPTKIKNTQVIKDFASNFKSAYVTAIGDAFGTVNSMDLLSELANFDDANGVLGDLANIFGDSNVTKDQVKQILDSFDDIGDATKEAILNSNLFTMAQTGAAAGTDILTLSLSKAKAAVIAFGKGLMAFATAHPIIAGLTVAIIALGAAFSIYKKFGPTHENFIEKLEEETETLKSLQSELQEVQSELEKMGDRIDELQAKGKLSFVEEEELNRLKQQTAELERQEEILQAQEKRSHNKQAEDAVNAMKNDPDVNGINWGLLLAGGGHNATVDHFSVNTQPNTINKYETNIEELKKAKADLEKANQELAAFPNAEGKEYKKAEQAVKDAQARVDKYNNAIDSMNDTWQTKYGEIGYIENATTEAEKQWNELYRQHQDYLDRQALINGDYGKATVLDRIFGVSGTDVAKQFKKELEDAVNSGKDPSDVINELLANKDYSSAFSGLEEQFGITMDNIKDYFTKTGEFFEDPNFDITKYTKTISSHSAVISEFQEAIQKLGKGSFTMDDFLDLIERYPDLAKGVDISSNAFYGLSRNLNKAIKSNTKSFINDLKRLKASLEAAGKETDSVDQLIEAIGNIPDDALDDTIERYNTLAEKIDKARIAQDKLLASMEENPNEGYENRGEAMEYMKEAMSKGEIGSESNLWNVAKQYGFTGYNPEDINASADALANFIAIRDKWWKTEDDGDDRTQDGYSYSGAENFIQSVESVVSASQEAGTRLAEILSWNYDETTGTFDFDFDNKNLDEIISILSQTEELAGLTSDEFMDLMVQVGQFFNIKWGDADDIIDQITEIANSSISASDKIEQMTDSVETYVEKALGKDIDFSTLTDASIDALTTDENIRKLLKTYLLLKETVEKNPLSINATGDIEADIIAPLRKAGLKVEETIDELGQKQFTFDVVNLETLMRNNGYTTENIMSVVNRIFGEGSDQSKLVQLREDLLNATSQSDELTMALKTLGVQYNIVGNSQGSMIYLDSNVEEVLRSLQFTDTEIAELKAKWETNGIRINTKADITGAEDSKEALSEVPKDVETTLTANDDEFQTTMSEAQKTLDDFCKARTATVSIETVTNEVEKSSGSTKPLLNQGSPTSNQRQNTIFAQGTAHANGSWGAPATETALVGELGPELLVHNGRWTTVGDNGAEFTQVKKGDIIFNHKQTKDLLSKGYVTGRGKLSGGLSSFTTGTAFASGNSTFGRYEFDGEGGWSEYDVNGNLVDSTSTLADAMDDAADSVNEFEETIDWIEIRMEEYDEYIGRLNAELENQATYALKNSKIDQIIQKNKEKFADAKAGSAYYENYAQKYLEGMNGDLITAAKDGAIAITEFTKEQDEATVKAIQNYREYAQKAADLYQQAEEILTDIRDSVIQKIDNIQSYGDAKTSIEDLQTEKLQSMVEYLETSGYIPSTGYYGTNGGNAANSTGMFENSYKKIDYWTPLLADMQKEFDAAVNSGTIQVGTIEWYEQLEKLYQVQAEISAATLEIEEFQNAINDIYWDNFDHLINHIQYLKDETQSLIDLMDSDDMFTTPDEGRKYEGGTIEYWTADDVKWTNEGIASLGLYAQQMEIAEFEARQYAEAIDDLTKDYEAGLYSENEYCEKLNELKESQYDAIESYEDAKDAIVDMNEARVDSIKDGISKEIEAYEELIEKKKKALNAEKD